MWATSDAFDVALHASSRRWSTRIDVMFGDEVVTSLNTMISGYIGMDDVAVRRECHFTIVDIDGALTPATARDLLTPKGTEVMIWRGLWVDSDWEWVPLGLFGIVEPEVRAHSEGTVIEIKGFDRVDTVRDRHFLDAWVVTNNTPIHQAIADIVTSRLDVPTRITASPFLVPETVFERLSDPWDAVRDLSEAAAYQAYFDQLGSLVVAPDAPSITKYEYEVGPDSLIMTSARTFSKDSAYSGVVVRGQHPDKTPITYTLWDSDPKSPTYADGPFGQRPYGYYSSLVTTLGQAQAIAANLLPKVSRITQECTVEVSGHPGHDIGDVVRLTDPRSRTSGLWQVISATIPLRPAQGEHIRLRCKEYLP